MKYFKTKTIKNSTICYFIIVVLFSVLRILSSTNLFNSLGSASKYILNAFIQIGFLFSVSVFLFSALQKEKPKNVLKFYGFKKMSWKAVLYSIIIGIIVYILNIFVASFFNLILESLGYNFTTSQSMTSYPFWLFIVNLIVTAVLPGICEETAHRGMLLKSFSTLGAKKAIIITGLLFGLLHLNIEQFFYATIIGFFLGYITIISDNIYPAIIVHFLNNGIGVLMSYSSFHGVNLGVMFSWIDYNLINNTFVGLVFVIALIVLLLFALNALVKALFKETSLKSVTKLNQVIFNQFLRDSYFKDIAKIQDENSGNLAEFMPFDEFDKMYHQTNYFLGNSSTIDMKLMQDNTNTSMDTTTKILLIATFVLTISVTILTFILGVI